MKSILRFFDIFKKEQKLSCCFLVFATFILAVLETIGISAILPLISVMGNENFLQEHAVLSRYLPGFMVVNQNQFIISSSLLLMGFYLFKNIFAAMIVRKQIKFSLKCQTYYATQLNALYLSQPYLFHIENNTATLLRNISSAVPYAFSITMVSMFMLASELLSAALIWIMLIFVDAFTAIIVAGVLGSMIYVILKVVKKRITFYGMQQNDNATLFIQWLNQGLGAIKETKVSRRESYFAEKFQQAYEKYSQANSSYLVISQLPRFFIEGLVTCGLLAMIIVKLLLGVTPADIVPILGVLALAAFRLMPCANRIISLVNTIKYYYPAFEEIRSDLMLIKEKRNYLSYLKESDDVHCKDFKECIKIDNLHFRYPQSSEPVFRNISFEIPKGSFVGIVGKTGAGKTTFVDILLGLFMPTTGKILVDGADINDDIKAWQANLAYVPQTIYLVDGSIRENIALGIDEKEIDNNKIDKVLCMAELSDFINRLPDGVNTMAGERGVKLSGGQRQRIGIARALYCDPKVLILDEATAALDGETEKNITDTILKLKGQVTLIVIAHRISTLEQCDFKINFADTSAFIL